jgi:hypothetical protein
MRNDRHYRILKPQKKNSGFRIQQSESARNADVEMRKRGVFIRKSGSQELILSGGSAVRGGPARFPKLANLWRGSAKFAGLEQHQNRRLPNIEPQNNEVNPFSSGGLPSKFGARYSSIFCLAVSFG